MKIEKTYINDLLVITPNIFKDDRGYFLETYNKKKYKEYLPSYFVPVQDNMSKSKYGTIRGLHYQQKPHAQSKLVRCTLGKIFDVAVDIRIGSKTFGKYYGIELSEDNQKQLFIPKGFAHGFSTLSDVAVVEYKCDELYTPNSDAGIMYNDNDINIDWKIFRDNIILSPKDLRHPNLREVQKGDLL